MKVCFLTLGTRGDVQPYLALAKKIISTGHEAIICTAESFQELIEKEGVEYKKASLDLMAIAESEEGKLVLGAPLKNIKLTMKMSKEVINPGYRATFDDFYEAAKGCDVILYHPKAFVAVDIALKLDIPCISMPPIPITYPITEFPCIAISSDKNFGTVMNKLTYRFNSKGESGYRKEINDFRIHTLGERKRKAGVYTYECNGKEIPILYPISKYLFEDVTSWNNHVHLSGFFYLDTNEDLSESIRSFLQENEAPIVISFSSMPLENPDAFIEKLEKALQKTNNRAILLVGNSGIQVSQNSNILVEKQAPHTRLFPKAKAIIHHGGAGTAAAALLSGNPQLIMPFAVDQPFWAKRLCQKGVSLKLVKEKELSSEYLASMLEKLEGTEICEKSKKIGERIRSENGLGDAVEYISKIIKRYHNRKS